MATQNARPLLSLLLLLSFCHRIPANLVESTPTQHNAVVCVRPSLFQAITRIADEPYGSVIRRGARFVDGRLARPSPNRMVYSRERFVGGAFVDRVVDGSIPLTFACAASRAGEVWAVPKYEARRLNVQGTKNENVQDKERKCARHKPIVWASLSLSTREIHGVDLFRGWPHAFSRSVLYCCVGPHPCVLSVRG